MKFSFGDFTLDGDTRQLLCAGREVHISPKAFDLLAALVEHRPKAMAKTDLQERLWPDTFVSEANLPGLVAELREALGDDAREPRFIRTVHRFGYAFCGEATGDPREAAEAGAVRYWLIWESRELPLRLGENILGREGEGIVQIQSPTVSRRHARIVVSAGEVTLEDLRSRNGTYLGDTLISGPVRLSDGDQIWLGSALLKFRVASSQSSTETIARDG